MFEPKLYFAAVDGMTKVSYVIDLISCSNDSKCIYHISEWVFQEQTHGKIHIIGLIISFRLLFPAWMTSSELLILDF